MDKCCTYEECTVKSSSGRLLNPSKLKAHMAKRVAICRSKNSDIGHVANNLKNMGIFNIPPVSTLEYSSSSGTHSCTCNECIALGPLGRTFLSHEYKAHLARISLTRRPPPVQISSKLPGPRSPTQGDCFTRGFLSDKHEHSVRTTNILACFEQFEHCITAYDAKLGTPLMLEEVLDIDCGIATLRSVLEANKRHTPTIDEAQAILEVRLDELENCLVSVHSSMLVDSVSLVLYDTGKTSFPFSFVLLTDVSRASVFS